MGLPVAWRNGPVPQAPEAAAFQGAAVWRISVSTSGLNSTATENGKALDLSGLSELYLIFRFTGDVARLNAGASLIDDDFYNGQPWQVGLKNIGSAGAPLSLSILPMPNAAPIYIDDQARRLLQLHPGAQLLRAWLAPQYESTLTLESN